VRPNVVCHERERAHLLGHRRGVGRVPDPALAPPPGRSQRRLPPRTPRVRNAGPRPADAARTRAAVPPPTPLRPPGPRRQERRRAAQRRGESPTIDGQPGRGRPAQAGGRPARLRFRRLRARSVARPAAVVGADTGTGSVHRVPRPVADPRPQRAGGSRPAAIAPEAGLSLGSNRWLGSGRWLGAALGGPGRGRVRRRGVLNGGRRRDGRRRGRGRVGTGASAAPDLRHRPEGHAQRADDRPHR